MKKSVGSRPHASTVQQELCGCGHNASAVAMHGLSGEGSSCHRAGSDVCATPEGKSVIKNADDNDACVSGCNVNNGNASARTVNCNNAVSNSNTNYASASAHNNDKKSIMACPSRTNITDKLRLQGAASSEYDPMPPYMEDEGKAETKAEVACLLAEIHEANRQKRLKNMMRFMYEKEIAKMAIWKTLGNKAHFPEYYVKGKTKRPHRKAGQYVCAQAEYISRNADKVAEDIVERLKSGTYVIGEHRLKVVKKKHRDGKDRNAAVLPVYDQVVQNMLLIVCGEKLRNQTTRHIYSNIPGRGIFTNNKTYCLKNKMSEYVTRHPDHYLLLTDTKKFYESLSSKTALGCIFDVIVDKGIRQLFAQILLSTENIPIGDTLSPTVANLVMSRHDRELLERFKRRGVDFFCAFGDDRAIGSPDKALLYEVREWSSCFLAGRFALQMKRNWHIVQCRHGVSYCKTKYFVGHTHVRAALKSRAIRLAHIQQRFAGYLGYLKKTDSKRLLHLINSRLMELRNRNGQRVPEFIGVGKKFEEIKDKLLYVANWAEQPNGKESEYYVRFQFLDPETKGVYYSKNGSQEIKSAVELWNTEHKQPGFPVHIRQGKGNTYYFEEYHTTVEEAYKLLAKQFNI